MTPSLHPLIDNGFTKGRNDFPGGKLHCVCPNNKVEVTVTGNVVYNHACGCSQCWKPAGALFSIIGVIPSKNLKVTANKDKLSVIDRSAIIQRYACNNCGVHLFGRVEKEHAFKGFDFIHVELSDDKGWQEPQFAAYVSSIIEQGFDPEGMDGVRSKLRSLGLQPYDALSPPLMDVIATYTGKRLGKL